MSTLKPTSDVRSGLYSHWRDVFEHVRSTAKKKHDADQNTSSGTPQERECSIRKSRNNVSVTSMEDLSHEEIVTSYVQAHVAQFDCRRHHLAFTNGNTTRNKLLQEIKASANLK
ncbi:hypothetical protein FEC46_18890 [Acinetobacter baumannii]|nr:hypothetical protein FEC46_18890 [Acinetobacter baumannii]